ncbi:alpha beta fold family protein, partial [Nannochloropsis gaditana]
MSAPRCRCVLPLLRHFLLVLLLSRVALPFVLPCLHRPLSAPSTRVFLSSDGSTATNLQASPTPALAVDARGRSRLPWRKEGYSYWSWQGHHIHYVALEGEDSRQANKPPIVLIHGFGASAFHWRYNIPALARTHRVFALDLLGFGLSDKPLTEYNAEVGKEGG